VLVENNISLEQNILFLGKIEQRPEGKPPHLIFADFFKNLINVLPEICPIEFSDQGLQIWGMDSSHISTMRLWIPSNEWDEWAKIPGQIRFSVNIRELYEFFKKHRKNSIIIKVKRLENSNIIYSSASSHNNLEKIVMKYELEVATENETVKIRSFPKQAYDTYLKHEINYPVSLYLDPQQLKLIINFAKSLGTLIKITYINENLHFSTENEQLKFLIKLKGILNRNKFINFKIQSIYYIEYFGGVLDPISQITRKIEIRFNTRIPIYLKKTFGYSNEGFIEQWIAPHLF